MDAPVTVDHLTTDQQDKVKVMLLEESNAFSRDENDVGCIPSLQLKIRLSDTTPQSTYNTNSSKATPKKVKEYLEDLLNRGWIQKSCSHSSSIVCVQKDGDMSLCVDYREINRKPIPDHHLIPRVQDMLNSLSGSPVLDQGKAYHEGFMEESSRPLTAYTSGSQLVWLQDPPSPFMTSRDPNQE